MQLLACSLISKAMPDICDISLASHVIWLRSLPPFFSCDKMYYLDHARKFSHPPRCVQTYLTSTCALVGNSVHGWSLIHPKLCPNGSECQHIGDEKHAQEFEHLPYRHTISGCQNTVEEHSKQDRQQTLRKHSRQVPEYQCQYQYLPLCPDTPFHCNDYSELTKSQNIRPLSQMVQQHCLDFAHICRFGRSCTDTSTDHVKTSTHVARYLCPYGDKCTRLTQEDHLNSFTHPKICDIRRLCKFYRQVSMIVKSLSTSLNFVTTRSSNAVALSDASI